MNFAFICKDYKHKLTIDVATTTIWFEFLEGYLKTLLHDPWRLWTLFAELLFNYRFVKVMEDEAKKLLTWAF